MTGRFEYIDRYRENRSIHGYRFQAAARMLVYAQHSCSWSCLGCGCFCRICSDADKVWFRPLSIGGVVSSHDRSVLFLGMYLVGESACAALEGGIVPSRVYAEACTISMASQVQP